jgi:hypothetical protein
MFDTFNNLPTAIVDYYVSSYLTLSERFQIRTYSKTSKKFNSSFYKNILDTTLESSLQDPFDSSTILSKIIQRAKIPKVLLATAKITHKQYKVINYPVKLLMELGRLTSHEFCEEEYLSSRLLLAQIKINYPRAAISDMEAYNFLCEAEKSNNFKKDAQYFQAIMNIEGRIAKFSGPEIHKRLAEVASYESRIYQIFVESRCSQIKSEPSFDTTFLQVKSDGLYIPYFPNSESGVTDFSSYQEIIENPRTLPKYQAYSRFSQARLQMSGKINTITFQESFYLLEQAATEQDFFLKTDARLEQYGLIRNQFVHIQPHAKLPILQDLLKESNNIELPDATRNLLQQIREEIQNEITKTNTILSLT